MAAPQPHRAWVRQALQRIEADFQRSSDTHLNPLPLAGCTGIDLYLKDESGQCHLVQDAGSITSESERLARACGGHYMDQFTYAERATDWRANNNIAESIYSQMQREPHPCPAWIVAGAGTGGTLATIGRYARYSGHATQVCGADPEHSVFFDSYVGGDRSLTLAQGSRIEGIGRPRVEASYVPGVLDAMVKVPDRWSLGAMRALSAHLGRPVGPSTGTNLVAALVCADALRSLGQNGSVVTLLCDAGQRYEHTFFDAGWRHQQGLLCDDETAAVQRWMTTGHCPEALRAVLRKAGTLI